MSKLANKEIYSFHILGVKGLSTIESVGQSTFSKGTQFRITEVPFTVFEIKLQFLS